MQEKTNRFWKQQPLQQTIIVPTHTLLRPRLDVITIIYVEETPKNICIRIHAKNFIRRHPIIITDADYDCILDEIEGIKEIEFEKNMSVISDEE